MTNKLEVLKSNIYPMTVHTWKIEEEGDWLIVTSSSKANGKNKYRFVKEEGFLFFYNGMDAKYCYFRSKKFQEFLGSHKIRGVKKEDPNKIYNLIKYKGGDCTKIEKIETDGGYESLMYKSHNFGHPEGSHLVGNCCFDSNETVKISKATYSILRDQSGWGTLITLKTPMSLSLPEAKEIL